MEQTPENSCGYHGFDQNGEPIFDYTCDDCMLPYNHRDYDPENYEEGNPADPEPTEDKP